MVTLTSQQQIKRLLLIFCLLFSFVSLFAQSDTTTLYVDEDLRVITKAKNAAYIYRSFKQDTAWVIHTYDKNNKLIKKDTYSDASLLFANGPSVAYNNGKPILKGMFSKGMKKGSWITYDTLGNVLKLENYFAGRLHGLYKEYTKEGKLREEGNYDWNAKKGEWKLFYDNGKLASSTVYEGENRGVLKEEYFDVNGNITTKEKVRTPAVFPLTTVSFSNYLYGKISTYSANMLGIVGKVECSFTIDKLGQTKNIKVISSSGNFIKEAKMAILSSPKWKPATLFGEIVEKEDTILLTFVR
jgi:antitoxin component YwqK of YwqJK toxin-antitoxin module